MESKKLALLRCDAGQGMFENEYAVVINLPSGQTVSLFADKSIVHQIGNEFFLEVDPVTIDPEEGFRRVLLPSEDFGNGSRWLTVPGDWVKQTATALEPA